MKKMISEVDHVIAVVKEMKNRMISCHKISGSNISIVSNTEPQSFKEISIFPEILEEYKNDFIVSYIGGFGPHRGVDTVIEGMQYLKDYANIKLLLVGKGPAVVMEMFHFLIKKHNLSNQVIMLGWQPSEKVSSFIEASNICLIPHHDNTHTSNTIPHKLFQYMAKGKPVLASSCAPLKRIVEQTKTGMVFESSNAKDFSQKIQSMYEQPDIMKTYGENGIIATSIGEHTWEHDEKILLNLYSKLIS